jgi:hypothetical protein
MSQSTDNQTPTNQQTTIVQPASLLDLGRVGASLVESNYLNADDPAHNVWPFAVLAPAEMPVPLIVWLPPFEDDEREAFVMSRWLPLLSLTLNSAALVVGCPVWAAPSTSGQLGEPRPTTHPGRWEMISLAGASRDGEALYIWADITRAPERAPQLGTWSPFNGEDVSDMMGWALPGAVGCFSPERAGASLERMGKKVLLHRFADDASRDEAIGLITSVQSPGVQTLGAVDVYADDSSGLFCVLERPADAHAVRELLGGLGIEGHPTSEQLGETLEAHVLCAPMVRAGCSKSVVRGGKGRGLMTEEDDVLFRTVVLAVGRAREEKGTLTKPVLVELPIRNELLGNRSSRRASARECRAQRRRSASRRERR